MLSERKITGDTEIRHLPLVITQSLARFLDIDDCWQEIAQKIPYSETDSTPLYTTQHLYAIKHSREGSTMTLINDWGTHGRNRPTVNTFIQLLIDCGLDQIANYLSVDVLGGKPVSENYPSTTDELRQLSLEWENSGANSFSIPSLSYDYLRSVTNNFNGVKYRDGGRKLGSGAFSDVFLAVHDDFKVAVKRSKKEFKHEFYKEVNLLSTLRHKNFIQLKAVSIGDLYCCLIYEYMENGSLQDRLACLDDSPSIPWNVRMSIASGAADGLHFLHSQGYVHRDVKSGNILLDNNWMAKLGDFGIAHVGPDLNEETSLETHRIIGTSVYMPKEAFHGIITFKLDSYSFGVVLLELLTGLKPRSADDDVVNIVMEQCHDSGIINPLLDSSAGDWDSDLANSVFQLACKCLESTRNLRPTMKEILDHFESKIASPSAN